jgi:hypothetical protein
VLKEYKLTSVSSSLLASVSIVMATVAGVCSTLDT